MATRTDIRPSFAAGDVAEVRVEPAGLAGLLGSLDHPVIEMNECAHRALRGRKRLVIVEGVGHLFEEPGTLDEVVRHATDWFLTYFGRPKGRM